MRVKRYHFSFAPLVTAIREILAGAVVGAITFLACVIVCFGLGLYSRYAFSHSALMGIIVGGILGLVRFIRPMGAIASGTLCGVGTATVITLMAVVYLSRAEAIVTDRATALSLLSTGFLYSLWSGFMTGVVLALISPGHNRAEESPPVMSATRVPQGETCNE